MSDPCEGSRKFVFLLAPRFPMLSVACAIETLRAANTHAGRRLYEWKTVSLDGAPVGAVFDAGETFTDIAMADCVFICSEQIDDFPGRRQAIATMRMLDRRGLTIGAISAGTYLMAEAGLLDGYRCTIHWEIRNAFKERFPAIECTDHVFETDRKRLTCAGGTAAIDLMLELVRRDSDVGLANTVANHLQHERMRSAHERQRIGPERNLRGKSELLRKVIHIMSTNLSDPLPISLVAKSAGTSLRHTERLFLRHMEVSPNRYYVDLRLRRARELLRLTGMSVLEVAIASGFTSHSYFTQTYRAQFGQPPSKDRSS